MGKKKTEVEYEVKRIEVHKKCPECKVGHMMATGEVEFVTPMMFIHKCNECGHIERYRNTYPYTEYRYKEIDK